MDLGEHQRSDYVQRRQIYDQPCGLPFLRSEANRADQLSALIRERTMRIEVHLPFDCPAYRQSEEFLSLINLLRQKWVGEVQQYQPSIHNQSAHNLSVSAR